MAWAPGERERAELFLQQRANRIAYRQQLMESLAGDPGARAALVDNFEALWTSHLHPFPNLSWRPDITPEPEFPETCPPTNQNIW